MGELSRQKKRELAKELYLKTDLTLKVICDKVGCSSRSLNKWIKDEGWADLKVSYTITKEQQLRRIYLQIKAINDVIEARPDGERFATSKEADTLTKLASAIKTLETETSISDFIDVFITFNDWLQVNNFEQAKEISKLQDEFIKDKLKHH